MLKSYWGAQKMIKILKIQVEKKYLCYANCFEPKSFFELKKRPQNKINLTEWNDAKVSC